VTGQPSSLPESAPNIYGTLPHEPSEQTNFYGGRAVGACLVALPTNDSDSDHDHHRHQDPLLDASYAPGIVLSIH